MISSKKYSEIRPLIKSGDILLCSGNSAFSKLIQQTTKSPWSHVGFILHVANINRLMVLESVESIGVRTVPLSHYVSDYNSSRLPYPGKILIARHDKFIASEIDKLSNHAIDLLDFPYDKDEIIKIASRICLHTPVSGDVQSNKRSYICSEYADECYRSVGINIQHGSHDFVTPADFFNDPDVKILSYIV